jgi:hypothetical protein
MSWWREYQAWYDPTYVELLVYVHVYMYKEYSK